MITAAADIAVAITAQMTTVSVSPFQANIANPCLDIARGTIFTTLLSAPLSVISIVATV